MHVWMFTTRNPGGPGHDQRISALVRLRKCVNKLNVHVAGESDKTIVVRKPMNNETTEAKCPK